ncbi:MAG TPA: molybdenum cofactor guanylyltransferase [Roseiflexaceae bacterium]|nr:molybdenum cofactor guanylyltransferase [Roseiflexaceae bacterium]
MTSPPNPPASAVVLAGGRSRRMGQDKRRLRLWGPNGPTLLEHTVGLLAGLCAEVIAVLNDPQEWPELPARLVPDVYPEGGALGGIYSGLEAARHGHALVVAADMPFLSPALLAAMLARPRDYDALLPRSPEPGAARNALDVEPLHAIYSRACLPPIRSTLEGGQRKIAAFFPLVRVAYVEPDEIARHDPLGRSFQNLNTPEQVEQALKYFS